MTDEPCLQSPGAVTNRPSFTQRAGPDGSLPSPVDVRQQTGGRAGRSDLEASLMCCCQSVPACRRPSWCAGNVVLPVLGRGEAALSRIHRHDRVPIERAEAVGCCEQDQATPVFGIVDASDSGLAPPDGLQRQSPRSAQVKGCACRNSRQQVVARSDWRRTILDRASVSDADRCGPARRRG